MSARTAGAAIGAAALTLVATRVKPDLERVRYALDLYTRDASAGLRALGREITIMGGTIEAGAAPIRDALSTGAHTAGTGALITLAVFLAWAGIALGILRRRSGVARDRETTASTSGLARVERARQLAGRGRPGGDIARETRLSRDAVALLVRRARSIDPDGIAASGKTCRTAPHDQGAAPARRVPAKWLYSKMLWPFGARHRSGTTVASGLATTTGRTR
jgi:hypothetical protein